MVEVWVTEVVYRVMRDLMTTEAADRVGEELGDKPAEISDDKALQNTIVDLWKDTNPIVGFLSRVRPPWQGPGIFKIDSDRFLSAERIEEIASWLPDDVRKLWEEA